MAARSLHAVLLFAWLDESFAFLALPPLAGSAGAAARRGSVTAVATEAAAPAQQLAEWCVASGREQAAVGLSGATTLAEALRDVWTVADGMGSAATAGQRAIGFPYWEEATTDPKLFTAVIRHVMGCGEVCEYLGESLQLSARHPNSPTTEDEPMAAPCPVLLFRFYARPAYNPADDPFYDPADDPFAEDGSEDIFGGAVAAAQSDEVVISATHKWVEAMIVHMKVCPFSSSVERAGMPQGGVSYPITRAKTAEAVYAQFWQQVLELDATDERELSTVLLITPDFAMYAPGGYDALADTLNGALTELGMERHIQLVFFHPEYTFRDGQQRIGNSEAAAANFARRSPYPMINLLRTPQARPGVWCGAVGLGGEGDGTGGWRRQVARGLCCGARVRAYHDCILFVRRCAPHRRASPPARSTRQTSATCTL